jgi:hypothetical protein
MSIFPGAGDWKAIRKAQAALLSQQPKQRRRCLGWCGKVFWSRASGNRFCPTCNAKRKALSESDGELRKRRE